MFGTRQACSQIQCVAQSFANDIPTWKSSVQHYALLLFASPHQLCFAMAMNWNTRKGSKLGGKGKGGFRSYIATNARCRQWLETLRPVTGAKSQAIHLGMPMTVRVHYFFNEASQCAKFAENVMTCA